MSLPTNSRILNFPVRIKKCALCGGTLLPEQPWHTHHRECYHLARALRGTETARLAYQAMREPGP